MPCSVPQNGCGGQEYAEKQPIQGLISCLFGLNALLFVCDDLIFTLEMRQGVHRFVVFSRLPVRFVVYVMPCGVNGGGHLVPSGVRGPKGNFKKIRHMGMLKPWIRAAVDGYGGVGRLVYRQFGPFMDGGVTGRL